MWLFVIADGDGDETTNAIIHSKQKRIGLMAFCRQQRKLDFVDRLLYHEMLNEQPQWLWSYFSPEMMKQIKNELCNTIMDDIINNCIYEQCIRIISWLLSSDFFFSPIFLFGFIDHKHINIYVIYRITAKKKSHVNQEMNTEKKTTTSSLMIFFLLVYFSSKKNFYQQYQLG